MFKPTVVFLLFFAVLSFSSVQAQEHFEFEITDVTMSILILTATIEGDPLAEGDEIGVFTENNLCAGGVLINEDFANGDAAGLAAWGSEQGQNNGFLRNQPMAFRIWDLSTETEYESDVNFDVGERLWQPNGFAVIHLTAIMGGGGGGDFVLVCDPMSIEAELEVGEIEEFIVSIVNEGEEDCTISNVFIEGEGAEDFGHDFEGEFVLEPDEEADIVITFAPQSPGEKLATLNIVCAEIEEPIVIDLRGEAIGNQEPHFEWALTDANQSIIVTEAFLDEELLVNGDEIGVFTPAGLCAGGRILDEDFPVGLAAWGAEQGEQPPNGFRAGEDLSFHYWDFSQQLEIEVVEANAVNGDLVYAANGFLVVELAAFAAPEPEFAVDPGDHDFGEIVIGEDEVFGFTVGNVGEADLIISDIAIESDNFYSDFEEEITITPGEEAIVNITFAPIELGAVEGLIYFTTNDPQNEFIYVELTGTGLGRELTVPMTAGWNIISINVVPGQEFWSGEEGPDIILMTDQLRVDEDNHRIELMKDQFGRFYVPGWGGFNNIETWQPTEGYQIKVIEECEAVYSGIPIPADTEIPLHRQWNIVAYLPTFELDAGAPDYYVLSSILDNLQIAKDALGRFMAPSEEFSNMPPWRETQGYQVKVEQAGVLVYPAEGEEVASIQPSHSSQTHLEITPTGQNMSVLINGILCKNVSVGDNISAFSTTGRLVGSGVVDVQGRCGLAVWGDDLSTKEVDGMLPMEEFTLRLVNSGNDIELDLTYVVVKSGSGLAYEKDGLSVLEIAFETQTPDEFFLSEAYPNPFNAVVQLNFGLPEAANVMIGVFDLEGRLVDVISDVEYKAGVHSISWKAANVVSGNYIIRMESGNFKTSRFVTLLK